MKKEDVRNLNSIQKSNRTSGIPGSYSLDDHDYMNIRKHLDKVIHEVRSNHVNDRVKVTLEHDIDSCLLKIPQVGCCGRIVKEWVTNTISNAFRGQHECIIKVTFKEVNHLRFLLKIEDNGIGNSPHQVDIQSQERKVVDNLIKLLNGKSTITNDHGTTLQVIFDFQGDSVELPAISVN